MSYRNTVCIGMIAMLMFLLTACGGKDSTSGDGSGSSALKLEDLDGTWVMPCLIEEANYVIEVIVFDAGEVTSTRTTYANLGCSATMMVEIAKGTVVLGSEVLLDGSVGGFTSATQLNITSRTTGSLGGTIEDYDLVTIKGSFLYFGDTSGANDGSSPERRPGQLDPRFYIEISTCGSCDGPGSGRPSTVSLADD